MAATPQFKVYDHEGQYQAAVKDPEAGAVLMSFYSYGDRGGSTIRYGHRTVVWTEGAPPDGDGWARDGWDDVAHKVWSRVDAIEGRGL